MPKYKVPLPPTLDPKIEAQKAKRLAMQAAIPKPVSRIKHVFETVALSNGEIRVTKDRAQRLAVSEKIKARVAREQDLLAAIRALIRTDDSDAIAEARLYIDLHDLERPRAATFHAKPLVRLITGEESGAYFSDVYDRIIYCMQVAKCQGVNVLLHQKSESLASEFARMSPEELAAKWRDWQQRTSRWPGRGDKR
jgi:hypothetical protein